MSWMNRPLKDDLVHPVDACVIVYQKSRYYRKLSNYDYIIILIQPLAVCRKGQ